MKRLLCLLLLVVFLVGCEGKSSETMPAPTVSTEPTASWIELEGEPWDLEGALLELPLNVPNGLRYTYYMEFCGDLLLWSQDNHLEDRSVTELCVLDLDTGKVLAQEDIPIGCTMMPQTLEDALYIIDSNSGTILKLDKSLKQLQKWEADIQESTVFVGDHETVYIDQPDGRAYMLNLETGEESPILAPDVEISYLEKNHRSLKVVYYHPDSGVECVAFIDLETGERFDAPAGCDSRCTFQSGAFLLIEFDESYGYKLISPEKEALQVNLGYDYLELTSHGLLLKTADNGNQISLHDLSGKALAQCTLGDGAMIHQEMHLISNEALGGYFLVLSNPGGGVRLLYWDTDRGSRGTDIPFEPVPEPSQQEAQIRERISRLESEYGVNILVGEDAQDYFYDFEAEVVTDYDDINSALDTLEDALEDYPDGFFRQLRYGDIHRTQIHLMGTITATNSEYVDTYEAFVQDGYDSHVVVMDIYLSDEATYYHEFSHVIDSFLEWDAGNREGAMFSEDTWNALNPDWFPGYTWDYSWQRYVEDYTAFIDDYSTIKPTEDRARVMEYAMAEYGYWNFYDCEVLTNKLAYYCSCIRDAFDTTGWPEELLWEQYLQ